MTKTQKEIHNVVEKIKDLEEKLNDLCKERLKECEFSIGDIVCVYTTNSFYDEKEIYKGKAYVSYIKVNRKGEFEYHLNKIKKDGTIFKVSFNVWGKIRLEKDNKSINV